MKRYILITIGLACLAGLGACGGKGTQAVTMDEIGRDYVKLAFQLSDHDPDYVDAYFGPLNLRQAAEAEEKNLEQIHRETLALSNTLKRIPLEGTGEEVRKRHRFLSAILEAMTARVEYLQGKAMTFDQESKAIYGVVSPHHPPEFYEKILAQLDDLLPGKDSGVSLSQRYNDFRAQFIIPPDKLSAVFRAAIDEGRKRTRAHLDLPENENFLLEYVEGKSWGAYNWFKGNSISLIQVNTDLPIFIDRALDLACHEGYPGHHVFSTLVEQKLYKERGWVEFSIYPLFSPQSLLMEGTANFGIQMAFPEDERIKFEKEVLFPLAGLDSKNVALYYQALKLTARLSYAKNDVARAYRDGKADREQAVERLMRFQLFSKERAEKYLSFIDTYGAYLVTYNLGQDMVKAYIEKRGGTIENPDIRWQEFLTLITVPTLPGDLL